MTRPKPKPRPVRVRRGLDELQAMPTSTIPEATLIYGYRRMRKTPIRIAPEPVGRPLTPVHDESGLLYGEPISEGRGARKEH